MAKTKAISVKPPRKLKQANYRSFRLHNRIKPATTKPVPSTWQLLKETGQYLWSQKRIFIGILIVYSAFTFIFVWAGGNLLNTSELKTTLNDTLGTNGNSLTANLALLSLLLGNTAGSTSELGSTYQTIIVVITSLAIIWVYRNGQQTSKNIATKDAFYNGAAPIVPFVITLFIIGIQLVPLLIASFLYGTVTANGLAVTALEQVIWILLFIACALLSLYMVSSSLFALYIVTLPNMTPLKSLRSARKLVLHRRLAVMRRLFIAFIILFGVFASTILLSIYFVPVLAEWLFFAGTLLALPVSVGFVYKLYKALL